MKQLCIYAGIGLGGAIGSSFRYLLTSLFPFQQRPDAIFDSELKWLLRNGATYILI